MVEPEIKTESPDEESSNTVNAWNCSTPTPVDVIPEKQEGAIDLEAAPIVDDDTAVQPGSSVSEGQEDMVIPVKSEENHGEILLS